MFRGKAAAGRRSPRRFALAIPLEPRAASWSAPVRWSFDPSRRRNNERLDFPNADSVLQAIRAVVHILLRPPFQPGAFFLGQLAVAVVVMVVDIT